MCLWSVTFAREHLASAATGSGSDALQVRARDFAMTMGRLMMAALLIEHAVWSGESTDVVAVEHWCFKLQPLVNPTLTTNHADQRMHIPTPPLSSLLLFTCSLDLRVFMSCCLVWCWICWGAAARAHALALDVNSNGMPQG